MDLSLERLYLLYQSGSVTDGKNNSNVLQVAKAVGKDLTLAEFEWVANSVGQVEKQFDPRKQSKDFQANLWTIPDEARERRKTDFQPTRDSKNQPIQMDDGSPESLERMLKSKSLDEVKHNTTLRNAWHAAQSGKLGELVEGNNLWAISGSQDELSAGLRGLSPAASIDSLGLSLSGLRRADKEGTLDTAIAKERKSAEEDLPSFQTYKSYGLDAMKERILSDNGKFNFLPEAMRNDVHDGKTLKDIREISDSDERADAASAWSKGFRDKHEQSIQQSVIDRRLNGFASGQSQSPKVDQRPTLDVLRQSVMSSEKEPNTKESPEKIRYYHGTTHDDASSFSGKTHVTPHESYARNYRGNKNNVLHTDFTKQEAIDRGLYDTVNGFPINGSILDGKERLKPADRTVDRPTLDDLRQSYVKSNVDGNTHSETGDQVHYSPHDSPHESGSESKKQDEGMSALDWAQLALDGVGAVEPTPFADLTNAGISLGRAAFDPKNAGQHLMNAGISLVSTIPYVGDVAKLAKGYGKGGKALGKSLDGFASSKAGKAIYSKFGGMKNAGLSGNGNASGQNVSSIMPMEDGTNGSLGGGIHNSNRGGGGGGGGGSSPDAAEPDDEYNNWLAQTIDKYKGLVIGVGSVVAAFRLLNQWVNKTAEDGRKMVEGNRGLAMYSGELSKAMGDFDAATQRRDMRKADYVGSSAADLAKSQSGLDDVRANQNAPYARTWNNIQTTLNVIATGVSQILTLIDPIGNSLSKFYEFIDWLTKNPNESRDPFEHSLREMDIEKKIKRLPANGKP